MSEAKVRGIVHFVDETKSYGQKGFRKRVVVLEQANERFTNYIPVEFTQDNCDTVDALNVGDDVEITYRLNGRKWQRDPQSEVKYFLNAEARSYQLVGGAGSGSQGGPAADDANDALAQAGAEDEDVPF